MEAADDGTEKSGRKRADTEKKRKGSGTSPVAKKPAGAPTQAKRRATSCTTLLSDDSDDSDCGEATRLLLKVINSPPAQTCYTECGK